MKKAIAVLLMFVILLSSVMISVFAEENHDFYLVHIAASDTVCKEKALIYDDEIYIPAESFSKYTRYEYDAEGHCFTIKGQDKEKAFKFIFVAPDKKQLWINCDGLYKYDLSDYFVVDGVEYLPFCQMLPFLNAEIYDVKNGVVYIANNEISLAEILYDFDLSDYSFNLASEFADSNLLVSAFILPSYLLDTVVNARFDRLDIVTHFGEYKDYKDIFSEIITEDNLYLKAKAEKPESVSSLLEVFDQTGGLAKKMNTVYEWIEKAGKSDISSETGGALLDTLKDYYDSGELEADSIKGITDILTDDEWSSANISFADCLTTAKYIYDYFNIVEDNKDMIDAVYDIETPAKLKNAEKRAAVHIYDLYSEDVIPAIFQEIASKYSQDVLKEYLSPIAVYTSTAKVAGVILKEVMPYSYSDVSKLSLYSSIVNNSSYKYWNYKISNKGETEKKRLSLLLCLTASKRCYEIMQETSSGYKMDESYYKEKVDKLERMIIALYAVAENEKFDSIDNIQTTIDNNIKKVKSIIDEPYQYDDTVFTNKNMYISDFPYDTLATADYIQLNDDGTAVLQMNLMEAMLVVTTTYTADPNTYVVLGKCVDSTGKTIIKAGVELHEYVEGLMVVYGVEDRFLLEGWCTPRAFYDGSFFRSPDLQKGESSNSVVEKENEIFGTYYSAVDYAAVLSIDEDGETFFNGVMDTIPRGKEVQVLGKETAIYRSFDGTETYVEYYRVKYNGNEGYVSVEELTR